MEKEFETIEMSIMSPLDCKQNYQTAIAALGATDEVEARVAMFKDKCNELFAQTKMSKDLIWFLLEGSDFLYAPSSTKFHSNFFCGLVQHSLNVFELFEEKRQRYCLPITLSDSIEACLCHDLCKVNSYMPVLKKGRIPKGVDASTVVPSLTFRTEDWLPIGHGEKSLSVMQEYYNPSLPVKLLVRWHMDVFSILTAGSKVAIPKGLNDAKKITPSIVALFTADYESTTFLEEVRKGGIDASDSESSED